MFPVPNFVTVSEFPRSFFQRIWLDGHWKGERTALPYQLIPCLPAPVVHALVYPLVYASLPCFFPIREISIARRCLRLIWRFLSTLFVAVGSRFTQMARVYWGSKGVIINVLDWTLTRLFWTITHDLSFLVPAHFVDLRLGKQSVKTPWSESPADRQQKRSIPTIHYKKQGRDITCRLMWSFWILELRQQENPAFSIYCYWWCNPNSCPENLRVAYTTERDWFVDYVTARFPFRINTIWTDNDHEFQAKFPWYLEDMGIHIKHRIPWLNGKVERSHGTDQCEFYLIQMILTRIPLAEWEAFYNYHRPCGSCFHHKLFR